MPAILERPPPLASLRNRLLGTYHRVGGEVVRRGRDHIRSVGAIGPASPIARRFGAFGQGSVICFPSESLVNIGAIRIGAGTIIAPQVTLSAGWMPDQPDLGDRVVVIGDRCLIGRGSTVIGHRSIEIGDDTWTGHNVHITDMNHGYADHSLPISVQFMPEDPVRIGRGSWLGHNVVVLPGVTIGDHVVIGAGSVVTRDVPDFSVAAGVPARVIKRIRRGPDAGGGEGAERLAGGNDTPTARG